MEYNDLYFGFLIVAVTITIVGVLKIVYDTCQWICNLFKNK